MEVDPHLTALVDQAQAAAQSGHRIIESFTRTTHGTQQPECKGFAHELLIRPRDLMRAGECVPCPHLSPTAPQPLFWVPYAPEVLRCLQCMLVLEETVTSTPEDTTCDRCRRVFPMVRNAVAVDSAVVFPHRGIARGPLMVWFALCEECEVAEGVVHNA